MAALPCRSPGPAMLAMTAEDLVKCGDAHLPQIEHLELDIERVRVRLSDLVL